VRVRYNLGLLLQQLGRHDGAEAAFREALVVAPTDLEVLYAYADHLIKRGRNADAMKVAERMIAAHPDQQIGHDIKAYLDNPGR
jgi:tetratricopeptide (TPR) repeat protein